MFSDELKKRRPVKIRAAEKQGLVASGWLKSNQDINRKLSACQKAAWTVRLLAS